MKINLIDLKRQYDNLKDEIEPAVEDVLSSTKYIMADNVLKFEEEFSNYLDIKHSIAVGNGTDALVIALSALGIGEGDEVITTPFTFFATAESIARVGAVPVFADVRLDTFNIDENKIEEKITSQTKAILPVHIFGQPCNMTKINEIAKKYNLYVIEDACQAIGAQYDHKMVGTLSDIACFSFFPTKNLGCAGDGGMIVTNNSILADICKGLRAHGSGQQGETAYNILNHIDNEIEEDTIADNTIYNPKKYYNYIIGYNSRLDELQAAILRKKLVHLETYNEQRRKCAEKYRELLTDTSLCLPYSDSIGKHVYHLYIVQSSNRTTITEFLKNKGIATGIYYPVPLHLQKAFKYLNYKKGDFPNAEYLSERTFALPLFPELNREEIIYVATCIKEYDQNEQ